MILMMPGMTLTYEQISLRSVTAWAIVTTRSGPVRATVTEWACWAGLLKRVRTSVREASGLRTLHALAVT